jgi:hypothetical protein
MVGPNPSKRPTATKVLDRISSLNECWSFALRNVIGCDTRLNEPCHIGTVGFATVFEGELKETIYSSRFFFKQNC